VSIVGVCHHRDTFARIGKHDQVGLKAVVIAVVTELFGIIAFAVFTSSLDSHLATLHLSPNVYHLIDGQRTRLAGITIPTNVSKETQTALKRAIDESFVSAFRLVALLGAALALLSAFSAWLLVAGKPLKRAGESASEPQAPRPRH